MPLTATGKSEKLAELVDEVAQFLAEREKDIAAHPVAVVIGGIVVGLILGRMLWRR